MGIFLTTFGESHFDFLKLTEVLSRGNRSMIDSRQAIFSLNVITFSNNYKRSEKSYGNKATSCNDMSLILVCSFLNFILSMHVHFVLHNTECRIFLESLFHGAQPRVYQGFLKIEVSQ